MTKPTSSHTSPTISKSSFGKLSTGEEIDLYTLANDNGFSVEILTWGGIIQTIKAPDKNGVSDDLVLGYDTLDQYEARHPFFGTITGRFANRIAKGIFTLDGETYTLAVNNGVNHLHGGLNGFDRKVWSAQAEQHNDSVNLVLNMTSPDGDEGYPGEVKAQVTYSVGYANQLRITYRATTNKPTPLNLTNHSYFNLAGHSSGSVLDHSLKLFAHSYLPVDETQIPTGEIAEVANSPFDFLNPITIGARIASVGIGYDHNYIIDGDPEELRPVAHISEAKSGRTLTVTSTKPGAQFYTGNHLRDQRGKNGAVYQKHSGFCIETQYFPDSINQPNFPSCVLRPGEVYEHETVFGFGVHTPNPACQY
jgi:aldose 1-epimerase